MHLQVAVFFLESEGRAVPWQHKSLLMGCLFLEIMKEEKKPREQEVLAAVFLLLVILFWFYFSFSFLFSWVTCTVCLISTWSESGQRSTWCGCAAGILWPSPRWRKMRQLQQQGHLGPRGPRGAGDSQGSRSYPGRAALQDWHLDRAELSLRREVKPGERGLGHKGKTWKLKGCSRANYFAVLNHYDIFVLMSQLKAQEVPRISGHTLPVLCFQEELDSVISAGSVPASSW